MTRSQRLPDLAAEILESLYQHRLLTTEQVRVMHAPTQAPRSMQQLLADLHQHGLVDSVRSRQVSKVWFLTAQGTDTVEAVPGRVESRRKLITPQMAAGQLQQHTLAVNDVGITYLEAARERAHEFGALSWRHEIAHPISSGRGRELLIADALITYLITDAESVRVEQRFLELDRATMPVDALEKKLERYTRLYHHTPKPSATNTGTPLPSWRSYYQTFPQVQVVLTGKPRPVLERRLRLLLALYHSNPTLQQQHDVNIQACLLDDLTQHGPFEQIWLRAQDPTRRVNWLTAGGRA